MSGTLYTLETHIRRGVGIGGTDAVVGFAFTCPHTPAVGWEISSPESDAEGTIVRIWWDAHGQQLRLYTEDVKLWHSLIGQMPEPDFEREVGEWLANGYVPLNKVAQDIARKLAARE